MSWRNSYWLLLLIIPLIAVANTHKHVKHKHWGNKYDQHFRKYSKRYFGPQFQWHWFKAQGIAESGLQAKAKNPSGATGIMQILPSTYSDIVKKNPGIGNISVPRWNIAAGIYYDRQIYKKWKKKQIPDNERLDFTFASYNAGYTKILRAYNRIKKEQGKIEKWEQIKKSTPRETRLYVSRINKLMVRQ